VQTSRKFAKTSATYPIYRTFRQEYDTFITWHEGSTAYGNKDIGHERTLGLGRVRAGCDAGGAPDTQRLIGRHTRMADDVAALWGVQHLSRFERVIHPIAWKFDSRKFA
jgi:hypothetical protein